MGRDVYVSTENQEKCVCPRQGTNFAKMVGFFFYEIISNIMGFEWEIEL